MATRAIGHTHVSDYRYVKKDIGGWADAKLHQPVPYDLVYVRVIKDGIEFKKTLPAWWNGSSWTGHRIQSSDQILFWKRKREIE